MKFKILFIFTLIFSSSPLCAMDHSDLLNGKLIDAVMSGNTQQAQSCLLYGAHPDSRINHYNNHYFPLLTTPLIIASAKGDTKIVKLLLKHHADINAQNETRGTALDYAVFAGHSTIVNILLRRGAQIDLNILKFSLLWWATYQPSPEIIELIIKYINHILDQTHDPKIYHQWDVYILHTLQDVELFQYHNKIDKINEFRMLLHHASKLPLSTKKLESLTAKELGKRETGEEAFRESVKHLRKKAF